MQTFPVARGVENPGGCNFCHEADKSLDTKPTKVKAREMIEMVADINAKFGDGKVHVTCWTCHQGSTKPEIARVPNLVGPLWLRRQRCWAAAVAGVAHHVLLSVRKCAVDCAHHDDHPASG